MPRRNRPKRVRRSRQPAALAVAPPLNPDRLALELVRRGKASPAILGGRRLTRPDNQEETP